MKAKFETNNFITKYTRKEYNLYDFMLGTEIVFNDEIGIISMIDNDFINDGNRNPTDTPNRFFIIVENDKGKNIGVATILAEQMPTFTQGKLITSKYENICNKVRLINPLCVQEIRQNGKRILWSNDGVSIKIIFNNLSGENFSGIQYDNYIKNIAIAKIGLDLGKIEYCENGKIIKTKIIEKH